MLDHGAVRRDASRRRLARIRPGAGDPHGRADLAGRRGGPLAEHLEQRAQEGERNQREPVERDGGRRRVDEATVQLRLPAQATAPTTRRALAQEGGAGGGVARGGDARGRDDHDAVAGESRADAEVERVVDDGQRVVEPAELVPEAVPHEHAARGDAEDVAHVVVLRLVELDVDDGHGRAERRERRPELVDVAGVVPLHELRASDRDARRRLDGGEQALERIGPLARCRPRAARAARGRPRVRGSPGRPGLRPARRSSAPGPAPCAWGRTPRAGRRIRRGTRGRPRPPGRGGASAPRGPGGSGRGTARPRGRRGSRLLVAA